MEIAYIGCGGFVLAAFITDIRSMRIPNILTLSSMISGFIVQAITGGVAGIGTAASGFAAGFGLMLVLHLLGAVGAGDVKIFGGIGAWMGPLFTLQAIFYSILIAGIIGLLIVLWKRELMSRLIGRILSSVTFMNSKLKSSGEAVVTKDKEEAFRFPFMLAVLPGMIGVYLQIYF
ncbi:prepilin peptidase [Neobacillus mesonae]|nr:prepilin peptidase [Neobacillus mesonae]